MNRFIMRRLICIMSLLGCTEVMASAFQIWEQDGASVGNYHAGYAAEANDASVAWYNPAGIPRIQNQQVVAGVSAIQTNLKYTGNVGITEKTLTFSPTPGINPVTVTFNSVSANGGTFNLVPNLQYVAPIADWVGFGFSVVVPFGLKTDYDKDTPLRYAATLTSIQVIDISPSLGMKISDNTYIGAGFDIQKAYAEFNSVGGLINPDPFLDPRTVDTSLDTYSKNKANDTGYGFRLGYLYEFNKCLRLGISYHSQVVHHFSGTSRFEGPLADLVNNGASIVSSRATTNVKLPPYTALSVFGKISPTWALMGSFIFTQWNTFRILSLNQLAGIVEGGVLVEGTTNMSVNVPEHYRNTWNLSLGANYYPTECITIRMGGGYDKSPIRNAYRNVPLPGNDRYALALGGHYQATKTIGFDASYSHIFMFGSVNVNPPPQVNGAETVSTDGRANGHADVLSAQVVWDIL